MMPRKNEFDLKSDRSRTGVAVVAILAALLFVAPAWADGTVFYVSSGGSAAGTHCPPRVLPGLTVSYGGGVYRGPVYGGGVRYVQPYRAPLRPAGNVYYRSGSAPGSRAVYGYNTGYYSRFEVNRFRLPEQRERERAEEAREREAERARREEARRYREATAYQPRPAEDYEVKVYGYEKPSYKEAARATLAKNQSEARAAFKPAEPPPAAKETEGLTLIGVGDEQYYYGDGRFHALDGENRLVEVEAPLGALVFSIPEEHETVERDGDTFYVYNKTYFARVQMMGRLVYKVVAPPQD